MGCINSKGANKSAESPCFHYTTRVGNNGSVVLEPTSRASSGLLDYGIKGDEKSDDRSKELKKSKRESSKNSFSFRLGFSNRLTEAEQVAACWPTWISSAAGEAIHGWVPLKAESFEKLEKIGQGTYSSVFRAREVETNKMVALKKVRFDNFQPESIKFMAREIMILRRLDHPNIMKLEGIITSRLSNSIYLVFEYMEHDLTGLISCPDIEFSETQVKCYMRQLLSAIEHCHLRGIMHRDIKTSNILVNNEGILKLGDFGLANVVNTRNKQPLTSRVVTLWYRPPELLMGSTNYGVAVDLWSIGCVFSELYLGKPILKGRTEVEQLHKIFKLCGSPSEEYWKREKLPHAAMFKPQHSYERSLREKCKDFPETAVKLLETFLSVEPFKRGTASSALMSEYFNTRPYPCDPSTLPKYPPNKEIDAKSREDARRRRPGAKSREYGATQKPRRTRKVLQEPKSFNRPVPKEDVRESSQFARRHNTSNASLQRGKANDVNKELLKPPFDTVSEISQLMNHPLSQGDSAQTVPIQVTESNGGFAWMKRLKEDATSTVSDGSKSQFSALDPSFANVTFAVTNQEKEYLQFAAKSGDRDLNETAKLEKRNPRKKWDFSESFDASDVYSCLDVSEELGQKAETESTTFPGYKDENKLMELSGPLLSHPHRMEELLQRNEIRIRRAARRSRFERAK